ncbi:MAG: SdiA-regulated domain-containing protein [Gemmatimonadaceae bacterium]
MTSGWLLVGSLMSVMGATACQRDRAAEANALRVELDAREARLTARAADTSDTLAREPLAHWVLPPSLSEISGIAVLADGRLVAHDDERARVAVIDPQRGVVLKEFYVGSKGLQGDFEGITVAGEDIYLMTSTGELYLFREGNDRAEVPFEKFDLKLGKECEFEGVAYDPTGQQLIMPCKHIGVKGFKADVMLYRIALPLSRQLQVTRLTIPIAEFQLTHKWKGLHPTDITRHPTTGNYVLVAAPERALMEITPDGTVVRAIPLSGAHRQAEGVAISRDGGVLIISDEANAGPATITLYRWPPAEFLLEPQ